MKSIMLICTLVLSFSSFSQNIISCFDASEIVDGGLSFNLEQTASGLSIEVSEMTFAGPVAIANIEKTIVMRSNYSHLTNPVNACSLSVLGKQETEFGHKTVRLNVFEDGFVGMKVQEFVFGYLHCSYLQSKNPDVICNPGGSDDLILVDEYVQTTKNFDYIFNDKKETHYSQIKCVKNDFSMLLTDHLICDNQPTLNIKIDL